MITYFDNMLFSAFPDYLHSAPEEFPAPALNSSGGQGGGIRFVRVGVFPRLCGLDRWPA